MLDEFKQLAEYRLRGSIGPVGKLTSEYFDLLLVECCISERIDERRHTELAGAFSTTPNVNGKP